MPLMNGDSNGAHAQLPKQSVLDFSKALEILESDYPSRDGLDIQQLMDSQKNGGLTYNDFLVLPGYIGKIVHFDLSSFLTSDQDSLLLPLLSIPL
jgi:IMP dehydrogenase